MLPPSDLLSQNIANTERINILIDFNVQGKEPTFGSLFISTIIGGF